MATLADLMAAAAGGQLMPPPQQENTLDRLLSPAAGSNFLDQLLQLSGRGTGGRGAPISSGGTGLPIGPYTGGAAPHQLALEIARRIERRPGFEVSGLHGFQGTPRITSGHIENSQHYGPGFAGDVSYVGGGRFGAEPAALDWLENWLQRRFGGQLTELIWREPEHYDHLHFGTRPGG